MWDLHPLVALGLAVVAVIVWLVGNRLMHNSARRERDELRQEREALQAQERLWRARIQAEKASRPVNHGQITPHQPATRHRGSVQGKGQGLHGKPSARRANVAERDRHDGGKAP